MPTGDEYHELFGTIEVSRESEAWLYVGSVLCFAATIALVSNGYLPMAIGLVGFGVAALFILIGYFSSASTRDHQRSYGKDEILAEHVQALAACRGSRRAAEPRGRKSTVKAWLIRCHSHDVEELARSVLMYNFLGFM